MRHLFLLAALTLTPALAAPVSLNLNITNGTQPFTGTLTTSAGQSIQTTLWQMYISNVALVKADGTEVALPGLNLIRLDGKGPFQNILAFKGDAPAGEYRGIRFDVGVPRALNHVDASTQKDPLGMDVGMFWAWNPGYIFSRYEGKATIGNQTTDVYLHMGDDKRRLSVNLADVMKPGTAISVGAAGKTVNVNLDASRMVSGGLNGGKFDLSDAAYVQVHGGAVADQLYLNLAGAFSLAGAPQASAAPNDIGSK
ncbi:MbnP family protein [Deinococcus sp.]|uniref:MbnP family protein n=1 Tax=Deinococcus sp. TaxID=47478 RepID=UPI003C7A2E97